MLEERTFGAVVVDGQLHHEESLLPWEGKAVQVTVQLPTNEQDSGDDVDVEKDVYLKMPVSHSRVQPKAVRDVGHAKPSIFLPEGLEDE